MPGSFCVSITCSKDNTDKITVGFAMANAAVASGKDTMVFPPWLGVSMLFSGVARLMISLAARRMVDSLA